MLDLESRGLLELPQGVECQQNRGGHHEQTDQGQQSETERMPESDRRGGEAAAGSRVHQMAGFMEHTGFVPNFSQPGKYLIWPPVRKPPRAFLEDGRRLPS